MEKIEILTLNDEEITFKVKSPLKKDSVIHFKYDAESKKINVEIEEPEGLFNQKKKS